MKLHASRSNGEAKACSHSVLPYPAAAVVPRGNNGYVRYGPGRMLPGVSDDIEKYAIPGPSLL